MGLTRLAIRFVRGVRRDVKRVLRVDVMSGGIWRELSRVIRRVILGRAMVDVCMCKRSEEGERKVVSFEVSCVLCFGMCFVWGC